MSLEGAVQLLPASVSGGYADKSRGKYLQQFSYALYL